MSLYLGRVGRGILKIVIKRPRVDNVVNRISNGLGKILGEKNYTPGLTRDLFLLSQGVDASQSLTMGADGVYQNGKRIARNPLGEYFSANSVVKLNNHTPEDLVKLFRYLKSSILDYLQKFGHLCDYIEHALPSLLDKCKTIEELKAWDVEVKGLILDYRQKFLDPTDYVGHALPKLLDKCKTIEELKVWNVAIKGLILGYRQKLGDPTNYVEYALPSLIEKCKTIEELKAWEVEVKGLILDYSQEFGIPEDYAKYSLPKLLDKCKTIEELKAWDVEVKGLILDYRQKFRYLGGYVKHYLPKLLDKCKTIEELQLAVEIAKGLIAASVDPSPLTDILDALPDKSILKTYKEEFIRFCKISDTNLSKNSIFFANLTKENAKELFDLFVAYSEDMKTSLFLPLLFSEYEKCDPKVRAKLVNDFHKYYRDQIRGEKIERVDLPEGVIEEINYAIINSTALTQEQYKKTIERFQGQVIPPCNFEQRIVFELEKASKEGLVTDKEISYLKERISWIEEALALKEKHPGIDEVDRVISDFPETDRPGKKPSAEHTLEIIKLQLLRTYLKDANVKEKIDLLIAKKEGISSKDLDIPEKLIEVFGEIKPEAEEAVRKRIEGAVDIERLKKIIKRFSSEKTGEKVRVELILAKTELDYFYGYMGENCTSNNPEELLNPAFTPMRIVVNGKIMGSIHTLTLEIEGKKTLVLPGIEPKESLLAIINAKEFTRAVIAKITEKVCKPNGYAQIGFSVLPASQSNRPPVSFAIGEIIKDKPTIKQSVQKAFPEKSKYSITELAIIMVE